MGLFRRSDPSRAHVFQMREKLMLALRGKMKIERNGNTLATVTKALIGVRDRFDIDVDDGKDLSAKGNVFDHEYEVKRGGKVIARVSRKWARVRDTYGIEIAAGEDIALLLAVCVAIEQLSDDD